MCLLFVHVLAGADRGLGCMSLGTHRHGRDGLVMLTAIRYANSCIVNQVLLCTRERDRERERETERDREREREKANQVVPSLVSQSGWSSERG